MRAKWLLAWANIRDLQAVTQTADLADQTEPNKDMTKNVHLLNILSTLKDIIKDVCDIPSVLVFVSCQSFKYCWRYG